MHLLSMGLEVSWYEVMNLQWYTQTNFLYGETSASIIQF